MSESFEISDADHLTTGAVGPPGERVFYIQARHTGQVVSLRLEKAQVAALVARLGEILADLPPPSPLPTDLELQEPIVPEWVVGSLGVSYDEEDDRIILVAEEWVAGSEAGPEGEQPEAREPAEADEPAHAVIRATRQQIAAFCMHGAEVVAAGRPLCSLCGLPRDPEGHVCIRLNGHRRIT